MSGRRAGPDTWPKRPFAPANERPFKPWPDRAIPLQISQSSPSVAERPRVRRGLSCRRSPTRSSTLLRLSRGSHAPGVSRTRARALGERCSIHRGRQEPRRPVFDRTATRGGEPANGGNGNTPLATWMEQRFYMPKTPVESPCRRSGHRGARSIHVAALAVDDRALRRHELRPASKRGRALSREDVGLIAQHADRHTSATARRRLGRGPPRESSWR